VWPELDEGEDVDVATHCNTLQHTATHYNTLQHTAVHTDTHTLQHELDEGGGVDGVL